MEASKRDTHTRHINPLRALPCENIYTHVVLLAALLAWDREAVEPGHKFRVPGSGSPGPGPRAWVPESGSPGPGPRVPGPRVPGPGSRVPIGPGPNLPGSQDFVTKSGPLVCVIRSVSSRQYVSLKNQPKWIEDSPSHQQIIRTISI